MTRAVFESISPADTVIGILLFKSHVGTDEEINGLLIAEGIPPKENETTSDEKDIEGSGEQASHSSQNPAEMDSKISTIVALSLSLVLVILALFCILAFVVIHMRKQKEKWKKEWEEESHKKEGDNQDVSLKDMEESTPFKEGFGTLSSALLPNARHSVSLEELDVAALNTALRHTPNGTDFVLESLTTAYTREAERERERKEMERERERKEGRRKGRRRGRVVQRRKMKTLRRNLLPVHSPLHLSHIL
jgi:flagellar basal body-associated protein FliL